MEIGSDQWFSLFRLWCQITRTNGVILNDDLYYMQMPLEFPSRLHHDNDNAYMT